MVEKSLEIVKVSVLLTEESKENQVDIIVFPIFPVSEPKVKVSVEPSVV